MHYNSTPVLRKFIHDPNAFTRPHRFYVIRYAELPYVIKIGQDAVMMRIGDDDDPEIWYLVFTIRDLNVGIEVNLRKEEKDGRWIVGLVPVSGKTETLDGEDRYGQNKKVTFHIRH